VVKSAVQSSIDSLRIKSAILILHILSVVASLEHGSLGVLALRAAMDVKADSARSLDLLQSVMTALPPLRQCHAMQKPHALLNLAYLQSGANGLPALPNAPSLRMTTACKNGLVGFSLLPNMEEMIVHAERRGGASLRESAKSVLVLMWALGVHGPFAHRLVDWVSAGGFGQC
jgi:hypothetical protein